MRSRTVFTNNLLRTSVHYDLIINEKICSQFALCPGIAKKIEYFQNFRESVDVEKISIKKAQILSLKFCF